MSRRLGQRILLLATLAAAAPAIAASGELHPNDYAYAAALPVDGRAALYSAPLTVDVYRVSTRADLGDLCVVNGLGEVVPFALRRPATEKGIATPVQLPLFPLRGGDPAPLDALRLRLRAGGTSLDIDQPSGASATAEPTAYLVDARGSEQPLTRLTLAWAADAAEFSGRLVIETSADLTRWQTVASGAPIVNLHFEGQDFLRADVALPNLTAPFLRLSWAAPAPAVAVAAVSGEREVPTAEATRIPVRAAAMPTASAEEYEFDLGAPLPLDRINLELPEENTVVDAEFLSRVGDTQEWRSVTHGRLYRLGVAEMPDLTNGPLVLSASSARFWKVRIAKAGGGLGHGTPTLVGGWLPDELLFVARGSAPFRLLYGNAGALPLAVTADALIEPSGRASAPAGMPQLRAISLGARSELGGVARLVPPVPAPDWKRWLLWAVLVAGVAFLGGMAWKLSKSLKDGEGGPRVDSA